MEATRKSKDRWFKFHEEVSENECWVFHWIIIAASLFHQGGMSLCPMPSDVMKTLWIKPDFSLYMMIDCFKVLKRSASSILQCQPTEQICCIQHEGINLYLEIQRGKLPMRELEFNNSRKPCADCTLRLCKSSLHCGQRIDALDYEAADGLSDDFNDDCDLFYGDSWFAFLLKLQLTLNSSLILDLLV
eukprot:scaffold170451_cov33-Attheya_sp.AAC.1